MKRKFILLEIIMIISIVFMIKVNSGGEKYIKTNLVLDKEKVNIEKKKNETNAGISTKNSIIGFKRTKLKQDRINILFLGIEGKTRTDSIIFSSLDPNEKKLDFIFIPRDTYVYEKGYDRGDQRKINGKYGRSDGRGVANLVEEVLGGVAIHHVVIIDYDGVEEIIDILGGVEVEVPFEMEVGGIIIPKGNQKLNGKEAINFLRFRKKYPDGDLGRIKAQEKFIKATIKKSLNISLPYILFKSYHYVETDMRPQDIVRYSLFTIGLKEKDITMNRLPGVAKYKNVGGFNWSYYFYNKEKTKELLDSLSINSKKTIKKTP